MKLLVPERGSLEVRAVWNAAARIISSQLLYPEARAAVARAARAGRLDRERMPIARSRVEQLWREVDRIGVTERLARRAGDLAEALGLRAYDGVHLASFEAVADPAAVLVSADADLNVAARALGFSVARLPT